MISKELELARHRVAARQVQGYTKRAIFNGEWDSGSLVQDELEAVRKERSMSEANPDD